MYLTRQDALQVITRMQDFESQLKTLFGDYNYDLHENIGRRNMLLSAIQEKETARVLRQKFNEVLDDGTPGKPDVVICDIDKELECKLTSGSKSKGTVSYSFQTDWATLKGKGSLDYVFIVANDTFDQFAVLFFEGLTTADYFPPASGSRGKSRMRKESAMKKLVPLVGDVVNVSIDNVAKVQAELIGKIAERDARLVELQERLDNCSDKAVKLREKTEQILENESIRYEKAINKLHERIEYWENNPKYSVVFEDFSDSEEASEAA